LKANLRGHPEECCSLPGLNIIEFGFLKNNRNNKILENGKIEN